MVKRLSPITTVQAYDVTSYGAKGDGSTDDTAAIQAALDAANTAGGGLVSVPKGTFIASNLTIHGKTTLAGAGASSILKFKTASTGNFIALNTPASDTAVIIQNIKLDGNSTGNDVVYFDNTGVAQDALHRLINVLVYNPGRDGISMGPAVIESNLIGCFVYNSGRYGYKFDVAATDNRIINCSSGLSLNHGFFDLGNNNHFTDCKAYYAGYTGSSWTSGVHGFALIPAASQDLHLVSLVGCEAQNNAQDGFHIDGSASSATVQHVTITNCFADGNNEVAGAGVGFYLNNVRYSVLNGNMTRSQSGAVHVYGLAIYGNSTRTEIGPNDFNGGTGDMYVDSGVSGNNMASNSFALPYTTVPADAVGGLDAPFGTSVARVYSKNGMQLVTANGAFDAYIEEGGIQNNVVTFHKDYADMHSYPIRSVQDPSNAQDAATKNYVDGRVPKITVGTSPPGSPSVGDVFIDTT